MTEEMALQVVAWVLTYVLYSSVLLGVALLLVHGPRRFMRSGGADGTARRHELSLRLALVGGVIAASVQLVATAEPVFGRVLLGTTVDEVNTVAAPADSACAATPLSSISEPAGNQELVPAGPNVLAEDAEPARAISWFAPGEAEPAPTEVLGADAPVSWLVVGVWALIASASLLGVWLLIGYRRDVRRLELLDRQPVEDPAIAEQVHGLARSMGLRRIPRVSTSPRLHGAIAFGVWRPEICLPDAAIAEMSPPQLRGVLAHEMAHHRRRDPMWQPLLGALRVLFWFQPLNHVAVRSVLDLAEFDSDERARNSCGDGLPLAQALLRTAERLGNTAALSLPGHAMAGRRARLIDRVQMLLKDPPRRRRRVRVLLPAVGCSLAAVPALVPSVGVASLMSPVTEVMSSPPAKVQIESAPSSSPASTAAADLPQESKPGRLATRSGSRRKVCEPKSSRPAAPPRKGSPLPKRTPAVKPWARRAPNKGAGRRLTRPSESPQRAAFAELTNEIQALENELASLLLELRVHPRRRQFARLQRRIEQKLQSLRRRRDALGRRLGLNVLVAKDARSKPSGTSR